MDSLGNAGRIVLSSLNPLDLERREMESCPGIANVSFGPIKL